MCCIWSMLHTLQRHRDQKGREQIRQSILGYQPGGGRIVCLKQYRLFWCQSRFPLNCFSFNFGWCFFLIKSKGVFALDAKQSSFRPVAIFASGYFASCVDARLLLVKITWHITVVRAITIIALSALLDLVLEFLFMLLVD